MASIITIPRSAPITDMVLEYDGAEDYLSVPQILLGQPLAKFSFEFWVNLADAAKDQTLWANDDGSFTLVFQPVSVVPPDPAPEARLALIVGGGTPMVYTPLLKIKVWYYLVVTYDADAKTTRLFVNTVPYSASPLATAPSISLGPARAGASKIEGEFLKGSIGQVRLWRGLLDEASVVRLQYLSINGPAVASGGTATLVGNWHTNEGYGDFAFDFAGGADASLGDGTPATRPTWRVSTILKPPDFIAFPSRLSSEIRIISKRDLAAAEEMGPSLFTSEERSALK